jgi:hypothetical protein
VAKEEIERQSTELPLFEWDRQIVDPLRINEAAAHVASCMRIGIGYAESRFVTPYVAYDLLEW